MQERGASLVEVVMVLGLTGVTLAFAGESFVSAAMRQHAKAVTTELAAELRAAHALAIKRRERIRVVFEPDTSKMRTELADAPQAPLRQYDYGGRGRAGARRPPPRSRSVILVRNAGNSR